MTEQAAHKSRSTRPFWRACRFLYPHRRTVLVSVVCAWFVGLAFTSGLSTMLPIMRVLINGDTLQVWMDRQIVEKRLGVTLLEDPAKVQIIRLKNGGPAAAAGLRAGDILDDPKNPGSFFLKALASPWWDAATVTTGDRVLSVRLEHVPWYLDFGRQVARALPRDPVWAVAAVFSIMAALACLGNFVRFFQEYYADKAAILAVNDIRRKLYDHVLHIPLGFFGLKGTSDVTSRLTTDTQNLQDGLKQILGQTIQEPIKAGFTFTLAMLLSWKLTLFIVLMAPMMWFIIEKFGRKMRRASRKALQGSSVMLGHLEGTLIGLRVVKAAGTERYERRRYRAIMSDLVSQMLRMSRIEAMSAPILESLTLLLFGVILLYSAYLVLREKSLEPGTFIMVMVCLAGMGESLRKFTKVNNILQKCSSAAARIFETLEIPVERPRERGIRTQPLRNLPPIAREVRFEEVTFSYPAAAGPALVDLSLHVPKGRCVAIVGRNGSGKTTLLALLPRFYEPQRGRILIDGTDVATVTLRSLRRQIGIVTQDSVIFPGTIAQNIAYGDPRPNRAKVEHAARRAFAHDFIGEKAQGYDTVLGEHGAQLSGGQKQRLCIARAIYRATPILILDEATSQVDAESEHLIQQAIETLMHERTTFIIAHRFSTILSADSIVVMDRGRIVGQGRHEELLATCEVYQQLYERQLIGSPA